jgi:hypothetical protein
MANEERNGPVRDASGQSDRPLKRWEDVMDMICNLQEQLALSRGWRRALLAGMLGGIPLASTMAEELPAPPYFISSAEAMVIGVSYDRSLIEPMMPAGLKVASEATGQVIMYTADEGYGLPAYSSAYLAVDLEGYDAPGAAKARWMLAGLYSPVSVTEALGKYFNYPVREGSTRVEHEGRRVVAVGSMGGREMIRAEMTLKPEPCQRGAGLIHEVTRNATTGKVQLIKVPYVADWCPADTAKVEIVAASGDPFSLLQPIKVKWAGLFRGGFGWSLAPDGIER